MALKDALGLQPVEKSPRFSLQLHKLVKFVAHLVGETLLIDELFAYSFPRLLVKLINRRADGLELALLTAGKLNHGVEELPVVQFHDEVADLERLQDVNNDGEQVSVRNHDTVGAGDVEVALVELTEAASLHLRVITSVHLSDVEALDRRNAVLGHISCEGHGQIVAQREQLAALVLEVVDELALFAVLARERLLELEDGRVDLAGTVLLEDTSDDPEGLFTNSHFLGAHIARALRALGLASSLISRFSDLTNN